MWPNENSEASTHAYGDKSISILIREVTHLTQRMDAMEKEAELHRMNSMALRGLQAQHDQLQSFFQTQHNEHGLLQEEVQNVSKRVAMETVSDAMPAYSEKILESVRTEWQSLQQMHGVGTPSNEQALPQEVFDLRRQLEEMLENISAKKLEVIEVMHTFNLAKQQAFIELAAVLDTVVKDAPSGVRAKEQSDDVFETQEQSGTSFKTESMHPSRRFLGSLSVPAGPRADSTLPVPVRAATCQRISPRPSPAQHSRQHLRSQARMVSPLMSAREVGRAPSAESRMVLGAFLTEHPLAPAMQSSVQSREHGRSPSADSGELQRLIGRPVMVRGDPHNLARSSSTHRAAQSMDTKGTALLQHSLRCHGPRG